jgi:hypothetical protein
MRNNQKLCLIALLLFAVTPAVAQEANPQIRIDKAACRMVTKHIPDADVAYKPNVDVHGKKVVPADITPPTDYHLEDSFELRLTADAVRAFGLKTPKLRNNSRAITSDTVFGCITLKHGKPYLNGKPLDDAGQNQLAVLCKSQEQR